MAVLSAAPRRKQAKAGSSWLGSPPTAAAPGQRRRATTAAPTTPRPGCGSPAPSWRPAGWSPVVVAAAIGLGLVVALEVLASTGRTWSWPPRPRRAAADGGRARRGRDGDRRPSGCSWVGIRAEDRPAVELVRLAQRAGRHVRRAGRRPVVRPARHRHRRPSTSWLRSLGATVGRGVWCETYWLPEPDLVELRDGATVNAGCVVQTHLFHDRVMSMDTGGPAAGLDPRPQQRRSCPRRPSAGTLRWARCRW